MQHANTKKYGMGAVGAGTPVAALLVLAWAWLPATCTAADPLKIKAETFNEKIRAEVDVSGNVVVGVAGISAIAALAEDSAGVGFPRELAGSEVCLRVLSRDGVYFSESEYKIPAEAAGQPVVLVYGEAPDDEIPGSYDAQDIAFATSPGACNVRPESYLVLRAGGGELGDDVRLYLNSFGATDVFVNVKNSEDPAISCAYIDEGRRTTFDFWCDVPTKKLGNLPTTLEIERERFGRAQPTVEVRLLGASEPQP